MRRRQWHPTPVLLPGKSMDGGAWWAAVHGVAKSQTRLSDFTFTFLFHVLEKEMATHTSVLAWRIPGTGEPGGLPSLGSHRVRQDWSDLAAAAAASSVWIYTDTENWGETSKWKSFIPSLCSVVGWVFGLNGAAAKSLQLCPTLCDSIDGSPPGSPVPGILQARTLEWVAMSFSNAWKWKVKGKSLSHVRLFATPWTAAYQAPPSMGLNKQ